MFDIKNFIMRGLRDAVGKIPDYSIILNASNYYYKGVLSEEDITTIQSWLDECNYEKEIYITTNKTE